MPYLLRDEIGNQFFAMRWLNRIAQGLSPGTTPASESPCKGGRSEHVGVRYCIDYVRKRVPKENLMSWFTESKNPRCRGATSFWPPFQGDSSAGQLPKARALCCSVRPLRCQEPRLSMSASRRRVKSDERSASGSVLVYVLVLVVIAGIIGASYLTFVDNQW